MHIGFTGTRQGMTSAQQQALDDLLSPRRGYGQAHDIFHHGDCQGSDAEAHRIAWLLGWIIHIHPPVGEKWRAYCRGPSRVILHEPRSYQDRNRAIVHACTLLIAAPKGMQEEQRSGTWSTVRYARKVGVPVTILWPEPQATPR